jgi:hypothetical protein
MTNTRGFIVAATAVAVFVAILIVIIYKPVEAFGSTSPGTLTQLASSRAITVYDVNAYRDWLMQRDRDIIHMTEDDIKKGAPLWPTMRIGAYA